MRHLKVLVFAFTFLFASCATPQKKDEVAPVPEIPRIHYEEIQNSLGFALPSGQTGFEEKKFDACFLGDALSELKVPLKNCRQAYFTLIQYQLSCRLNDQPTGVLSEDDLSPVSNRKLTWTMGNHQGASFTDERGAGTIRLISGTTQRKSYLRISTGVDFMMLKAKEITSVVTPASWCTPSK